MIINNRRCETNESNQKEKKKKTISFTGKDDLSHCYVKYALSLLSQKYYLIFGSLIRKEEEESVLVGETLKKKTLAL